MPPTPARGSQKPDRGRQGSSAHPTPHPYQSAAGSKRGAATTAAAAAAAGPSSSSAAFASGSRSTPFVHPALVASASALPATIGGPSTGHLLASSSSSSSSAAAPGSRGRKPFNHRNLFAKDLRNLMYAYGDVANPDPDSVAMLEEMTVEFITDLCCRARPSPYALGLGTSNISTSSSAYGATLLDHLAAAVDDPQRQQQQQQQQQQLLHATSGDAATLPPRAPHRQRVKLEDFRHVLRKDVEAKKLGRLEQLLYADRIVTEARKVGGVEEVAEKAGALNVESGGGGAAGADGEGGATRGQADAGDDQQGTRGGRGRGRGRGGRGTGRGRGGGRGRGTRGRGASAAPSSAASGAT